MYFAFLGMRHAVEVVSFAGACVQIVAVTRATGGLGSCALLLALAYGAYASQACVTLLPPMLKR